MPPTVSMKHDDVLSTYPIPGNWQEKLPLKQSYDIPRYRKELEEMGWHRKSNSSGLIDDLVRIVDSTPQAVKDFSLKWGPSWYCDRHKRCCWVPEPTFPARVGPCRWYNFETTEEFTSCARQIQAALKIAACLHSAREKTVPDDLWLILGYSESYSHRDLSSQRHALASAIQANLQPIRGSHFQIDWVNEEAELSINSGWGFSQVAWLQVAQIIAERKNLYTCDGCQRRYIRQKRRPQQGQRNYCNACGKTASNRDWARRTRSRSGSLPE